MEEQRREISPAATPGPEAVVATALSILMVLARPFGLYISIALAIIIVGLLFDILKLAFVILKVLTAKRPDGTGFLDSVYYEIGRGESSKGILIIGFALLVAGVSLMYFAPKASEPYVLETLLSANLPGIAGGFIAGLGFYLVYVGLKGILKKALFGGFYYEDPEVKKVKSEMMAAFKQGRTQDAINLFKMELKTLTDQFDEANALKFDFNKEEKQLADIATIFKKAEKYCKAGSMKEADAEMNSAKKRYEDLRPKVSNKLRSYGRVKTAMNDLKKLSKEIEDSLRDCSRNGLNASPEIGAYKKLDMNRVLLASESFWRDDNFKEALRELENLKGEYTRINDKLTEKLEHYNELLSRKYPCLKCGKNMNLANNVCPSCGTNPSEGIIEVVSNLVNKLEETAKKLQEAEWLMNFETERSGVEEINVALTNIAKQVEQGEFDRATSLLMTTKASQEALVSEMSEKLELYDKISGKLSEIRGRSVDIKTMIEQNKRDGIDIREEEATYLKTNENTSLGMIEGLCKSGAFSETSSRLEKGLSDYDRVKAALTKKASRYKDLSTLIADLEKKHSETTVLLDEAKKRRVEVSIEERDLRIINPEAMKQKAKMLTSETEKEIKEGIASVGRIKESLSKKVEMFNRLEGMGAALEEKMTELRTLVSKGIALKLDIKEEHEKFYTIKMERIRDMLKSCDDIVTLKKELDTSLDTAQWCIASLTDKLSGVQDAPRWAEVINSAMKDRDMAEIDSLRSIPRDWRSWAVERYMENNPEDAFVIYQNKLIKTMSAERKRRYEDILGEISSAGKVKGCFMFDDRGVVVASSFPELKEPMPLGGPAAFFADNGRALARIAGIGKAGQVVVGADDFKVTVVELGKSLFLLCSLKPKENVAFTSISIAGSIKKLQDSIG